MDRFPNRAIMAIPNLSIFAARSLAVDAAREARRLAPKLTVASASLFVPIWGENWFGIKWQHPYVMFQEAGTRPFTMRSLAGKTIPMWIDDPSGEEASKNPNAKTRVTASGRRQTLIFRRAAKNGQRKNVRRMVGGRMTTVSVPMSYPGAPGRIAVNRSRGIIRQKDVDPNFGNPGWIAKGNVGVRWRHPGLKAGRFLAGGMEYAAHKHGYPVQPVMYRGGVETTADISYRTALYEGQD